MRAIPVTSPRRRPRQARAQATVEAIIKATAHVLTEEGYDRASTNRIAQAANVSIGSLYQYFPSKEALVAALVDEHLEKMTTALRGRLQEVTRAGLPHNARVIVEGLVAAYRVDPVLHHVLCQEVPKIGELRRVYEFEAQLAELSRGFLRSVEQQLRVNDLDRATFILVNTVPNLIRASVHADPEGHSDAQLVDDATDLIMRYLMVDMPSAPSAPPLPAARPATEPELHAIG